MGLFDSLRERAGMVDRTEDHLDGHGFDPDVCVGCENRDTSHADRPCTLCGCPTVAFGPMDLSDAPPESCIRLDGHAR